MNKKHQLFLVLDGATSLLWGATQEEGTEPVTQDLFREWMHVHSCKPKWVVADMAFFTPSWMTFWKTHETLLGESFLLMDHMFTVTESLSGLMTGQVQSPGPVGACKNHLAEWCHFDCGDRQGSTGLPVRRG